jgi:glycosyltransferase involved in cell wall biosynthesis
MGLLFLTETIPYPLDSGGRIKTYNTLRILAREHEVHCHAVVRDRAHLAYRPQLEAVCAHVVLHHVPRTARHEAVSAALSQMTGVPFVVRRHFHRVVLDSLLEECRRHRFDAVYCDHLSMLEYGRRLKLPLILDAHNIEYEIIRRHAATLPWSPVRLFAEMEWRRLARYERRWYRQCRSIFAVSDVDARTIRALAPGVTVHSVPISVDVSKTPRVRHLAADPEILFVGGLHWPPNADAVRYFIDAIFPAVKQGVPAARFTVIGRGHETLARRVPATAGVRFMGHVDDVEPFFRASRVMVAPIRSGSGMRVKILDALARGVPTVSTAVGCEGISATDGVHLLIADRPDDFAQKTVTLLRDASKAQAIADAAHALALEKYDTSVIRRAVLDAVSVALDETRGTCERAAVIHAS